MELNKDLFYIYFGFLFNLLINKVNKVPNFYYIISTDLFNSLLYSKIIIIFLINILIKKKSNLLIFYKLRLNNIKEAAI